MASWERVSKDPHLTDEKLGPREVKHLPKVPKETEPKHPALGTGLVTSTGQWQECKCTQGEMLQL